MIDQAHHHANRVRVCSALAAFVAGLVFLLLSSPASAHHTSTGPTTGLSIPGLTHGQMAVIAAHRSEILALADQQLFTSDETFFRLRNYVDLQLFYCFWGMLPGSISDEASPFNECSHAYLSGLQALLLHMQHMRGDQTRVISLIDAIEIEMLTHNASMVLCQYSNEPFNTADHIEPHWREIPFHAPTMLTFAGFLAVPFGAGGAMRFVRRARRKARGRAVKCA
jgi:hypothetical protein